MSGGATTADVHGDAWARGAAADHAVNVATGGPPAWLRAALAEELATAVAAYPDEREAVEVVARRHGRATDEVVMLNGAAHGFQLVADVLAPRRPVVVHPQFTEPDRALGGRARHVLLPDPYDFDPEAVPDDADLVVIGNPTNPTGVLHPADAITALVRPGRTVVVDEAFMDFVAGEEASLAARATEGLVVLRSLTKILGAPGLRVGYLLAPPDLAGALRARRQAWPVNALALLAVEHATPERLRPIAARARADRRALEAALQRALPLGRVHVYPGAANFVLVELATRDALALAHDLRDQLGIAIRPASTFPGLTPRHVRLTARGGETDARLIAALSQRV
ncbi:putative aminotransferase [Baekduia alba]|uniref:aminotransferase class I/II-fold pyridoxal phosphate-dependent enzyme n=1 Tax=Baekduia alba TaxID=2997333 RepID=UPI0023413A63|nr:aminotransferase class I/II-fold pyridoxal phosphate-dependent enzyme [Baekduia alba]WCB93029.1 putative aminotransferase [Baekduia alba]